jgi:glycyl-tRNA synthetase beta chain
VKGFSYDVVNAVMAAGWDDVKELAAMLAVVRDFAGDAEFLKVCALFKRVKNILSKENYTGSASVNDALFETAEERALWTAFNAARGEIEAKQASANYAAVLQAIATLAGPVDAFFTSTMVNTHNAAVRENRLSLLSQIQAACNALADFSLLVPA